MLKLKLPDCFTIFDMEWTAWDGSVLRNWTEGDEFPEIFNIGAVRVMRAHPRFESAYSATDSMSRLIQLDIVAELPAYSENLSRITRGDLAKDGIPFKQALTELAEFAQNHPMYFWDSDSYLADAEVMELNLQRREMQSPFWLGQMVDIRPFFRDRGIFVHKYSSSTIPEVYGLQLLQSAHRGESDAQSILMAVNAALAKEES